MNEMQERSARAIAEIAKINELADSAHITRDEADSKITHIKATWNQ